MLFGGFIRGFRLLCSILAENKCMRTISFIDSLILKKDGNAIKEQHLQLLQQSSSARSEQLSSSTVSIIFDDGHDSSSGQHENIVCEAVKRKKRNSPIFIAGI